MESHHSSNGSFPAEDFCAASSPTASNGEEIGGAATQAEEELDSSTLLTETCRHTIIAEDVDDDDIAFIESWIEDNIVEVCFGDEALMDEILYGAE